MLVDKDMSAIKSKGQYFTPELMAEFMISLISKNPSYCNILEPCAGTGVFLKKLSAKGFANIYSLELDSTLPNTSNIRIFYQDFFDYTITNKFDVVIGNPPYVRWKNQTENQRSLLLHKSFWGERMNGLTDILQPFIFKAIEHLNENGELIFITPKFWTQTLHSAPLRKFLLENGYLDLIIDLNEKNIFPEVSLNLIIFKFIKQKTDKSHPIRIIRFYEKTKLIQHDITVINKLLNELEDSNYEKIINLDSSTCFWSEHPFTFSSWNFIPILENKILNKIESACLFSPKVPVVINGIVKECFLSNLMTKSDLEINLLTMSNNLVTILFNNHKYWTITENNKLTRFMTNYDIQLEKKLISRPIRIEDIFEIGNGMVSGLDRAFQISNTSVLTFFEQKFLIKVIKAKSLKQYYAMNYDYYFFIPNLTFKTEDEFKLACPNFYIQLFPFRAELLKRWVPPNSHIQWWEWAFPRNKNLMDCANEMLAVPCKERFDTKKHVRFVYLQECAYTVQDVTVLVKYNWVKESLEYLLAYLNSELVFHWLLNKGMIRGGVIEFSERPLSEIPVRLINWSDKNEIEIHNSIKENVNLIVSQKSLTIKEKLRPEIEHLLEQLLFANIVP